MIPIRFEPDPDFDSQDAVEVFSDGSEPSGWRIRLAGVAHEIRNPLAAVCNAVSLLRRHGNLDWEERGLIDLVLEEVRRVDRLVEDFQGSLSPSRKPWEIGQFAELVDSVLPLIRQDPRLSNRLILAVDVSLDLPRVRMQRDRMRQVLWNLLLNAIEAVAPAGAIRLEIRSAVRNDRMGVRVVVSDDGPGMPPERRAKAFEPFQTTKAGGSGLGLTLCRELVLSHGGSIGIDENREGGTRAWFWVPAAETRS